MLLQAVERLNNSNVPNTDFHTDYVEYQGKLYLLEYLSSSLLTRVQSNALQEEIPSEIEE